MKKHKETTAQEQSCAVASFLFFRVERTDQNEDSADHIDCRDRSRARRPLGSSGSALVDQGGGDPGDLLCRPVSHVPGDGGPDAEGAEKQRFLPIRPVKAGTGKLPVRPIILNLAEVTTE